MENITFYVHNIKGIVRSDIIHFLIYIQSLPFTSMLFLFDFHETFTVLFVNVYYLSKSASK